MSWLSSCWNVSPGRLPCSPWSEHAALIYAGRGWHVFPVVPDGKRPLTARGFKAATVDPDQIRDWWRRWPDAGVGIATGASGLLVVDVDVDKGGWESFQGLADRLPATLAVCTGGGGLHLYYKGHGRSSASKLAPGIDTRGQGGYVVAPPSGHKSGSWYWWSNNNEPAAAPGWLLEEVDADGASEVARYMAATAHYDGVSLVGGSRLATAALEGACDDVRGAGKGQRNDVLLRKAARLMRRYVCKGELDAPGVRTALVRAAVRAGLTPKEAERTVANGFRYGVTGGV